MTKQILLLIIFAVIGAMATIGAFFFLSKQQMQLLSPLSITQFSLEKAPNQSLVGTIATMSGDTWWQSRTADTPTPITKPRKIQQGESLQTGSTGEITMQFPAVVSVDIAKNSSISIIQTLPANIVLEQTSGSITYTSLGIKTPISIRAFDLLITVTTGQIHVGVDEKNQTVRLVVINGSTTIAYTDTINTTIENTLTSGQTITFYDNSKTVTDY